MNVLKSNRRALVVLGIGAVAGAAALFFFAPQLIGWFLAAALLVGVVWIGSHHLVRLLERRKQRRFDAGVAAREGIEDRKREWASWTAELEQQGIDRYDLPFFLLVGEPQSGKSVLLQNSDLTFPFGQTRLSGIGGTRGCDWWFTEEAVILDLAGRLFTHEGGASDEAEWEAFLGLLASYRPVCPANGVMLVIPCDSLLSDSRDVVARKASRIQDALLTLTNQLQAQLPIYVVLTKADRIFGFAETVHRLESEQRHQMFGWSRPAEDYEAPFDMVEVRRAFDAMVGRARTLRETMMSTVRLPEGVPEVDRMYAFPDELEAIAPSLEVYLKRIFSESKLVDRLFFRGFYLTSGLQTGTPIANVCAELYGGAGEADARDLSALFTRQQAYFIKDLVRRRVFSERGLVRPTAARVARAKRNAWVGYGAAAALALVSVVWSVAYVLGEHQQGDLVRFRRAIGLSAGVANARAPEVDGLLAALDATWSAQQVAPRSLETAGVSRTESFEELYCTLCDLRLVPAVRRAAEARVAELAAADPRDHAELRRRARQVRLLLAGFEPGDDAQLGALEDLLDERHRAPVAQALQRRAAFADATPIPISHPAPGGSDALARAAQWIDGLWERATTGGDPLQIGGAAGYVVAWRAVDTAHGALSALDPGAFDRTAFAQQAVLYHRAGSWLRSPASKEGLPPSGARWRLARRAVDRELDQLAEERALFVAAHTGARPESWRERELLSAFEDRVFGARPTLPGDVADAVDGPRIDVPTPELDGRLVPELVAVCAPQVLGSPAPVGLHDAIATALQTAAKDGTGLATRVVQAKCRILQDDHLARFGDWPALAAELGGTGTDAEVLRRALVPGLTHLAGMLAQVPTVAPEHPAWFERWTAAAARALTVALDRAEAVVADWSTADAPGLDPELLRALVAVRARAPFAAQADRLLAAHVSTVGDRLLAGWVAADPDAENTAAVLRGLADHLTRLRSVLATDDAAVLVDAWLRGGVRAELERRLGRHLDLLRRASDIPGASVALTDAVRDVDARLTPQKLKAWQDGLAGWKVLEAGQIAGSVEALRGFAAIAEPVDALWRTATRERSFPTYLVRPGARADQLEKAIEPLRALPQAGRGTALAKAVRSLRSLRVGAAPLSSADWYLDELFETIETKAVAELRALYVADLRREFEFRASLGRALYAEPTDFAELVETRRTVDEEVDRFFGPGGELDALRTQYLLDGAFEFRPSRDDPAWAPVWAFDAFLAALSGLMRPDPAAESLGADPLEIRLAPIEPNKGAWAYNYLFTNVQPGDDHFVDTATLETRTLIGPLAWRFGADGTDELWFRWTRSVSGDEQADDASLRIGSCLAPLALVWKFGAPATPGDAAEAWTVDAATRGRSDVRARFTLRFARPVPVRPAYPWGA